MTGEVRSGKILRKRKKERKKTEQKQGIQKVDVEEMNIHSSFKMDHLSQACSDA